MGPSDEHVPTKQALLNFMLLQLSGPVKAVMLLENVILLKLFVPPPFCGLGLSLSQPAVLKRSN